MSNAPYLLAEGPASATRSATATLVDSMTSDGLTCTFDGLIMAEQNSDVSAEVGITREQQDAWALRSHERAIAAIDAGRLADEIAPVTIPGRRGDTVVDTDEGPRRDTSAERLAALPPVFTKDGATTAGNAPGGERRRGGARARVARTGRASAASSRWRVIRSAGLRGRRLRLPRAHARGAPRRWRSRRPGCRSPTSTCSR